MDYFKDLDLLDWLDKISGGNGYLCVAAGIGVALLIIGVVLGCVFKNYGVYAGISTAVAGGIEGVFVLVKTAGRTAVLFRAGSWIAVGVLGLLTALVLGVSRRVARRKNGKFVNAARGACLPERDNSYLRARLSTALQNSGYAEKTERKSVPYENRGAVRLGYARRLIAGVQDAPLSPAERLETDTLARSFAEYSACEKWDAEQLRSVNELFARLLKLAAKYSVEPKV